MKTLIIVCLAVGLAVAIGWISFSHDNQEANIRINTEEIRQDTQQAVLKSKALVRDAQRVIDESNEKPMEQP